MAIGLVSQLSQQQVYGMAVLFASVSSSDLLARTAKKASDTVLANVGSW